MNRALRGVMFAGTFAAALALASCGSGTSSAVGTWGDPDDSGSPSITFNADGDFAGTDGCNRLGGSWEADGDAIDLGEMISTLMYCEDVDTWLSKSRTAQLTDGKLVFLDEAGEKVGTLEPAQ